MNEKDKVNEKVSTNLSDIREIIDTPGIKDELKKAQNIEEQLNILENCIKKDNKFSHLKLSKLKAEKVLKEQNLLKISSTIDPPAKENNSSVGNEKSQNTNSEKTSETISKENNLDEQDATPQDNLPAENEVVNTEYQNQQPTENKEEKIESHTEKNIPSRLIDNSTAKELTEAIQSNKEISNDIKEIKNNINQLSSQLNTLLNKDINTSSKENPNYNDMDYIKKIICQKDNHISIEVNKELLAIATKYIDKNALLTFETIIKDQINPQSAVINLILSIFIKQNSLV